MIIFIENPANTTLKKEFDEKTKKWKTIGHFAVPYPFPYGFIPSTLQKNGDPLDAFLITNQSSLYKRGQAHEAVVLGIAEYYEDDERDYKILVKKEGEKVSLCKKKKNATKNFLIHAFDNQPEKSYKFNGFFNKSKALKEIEKCISDNINN
jgi:inorganic pyrophosphatase